MPPLVIAEVAYGEGLLDINPHLHISRLDAKLELLKYELWKLPRKIRLVKFPHTCVRQPLSCAQSFSKRERNRHLLPVYGGLIVVRGSSFCGRRA